MQEHITQSSILLIMNKHAIFLKNETVPFDPYKKAFEENLVASYFVPLLTHKPINHPQIVEFLASNEYLDSFKAFIITSQRCIESLDIALSLIEDPVIIDKILSKPAYTVGPATYDVLDRLGFKDIRGGINAGNGSILSDLIVADSLFKEGNKKILFLTGEIRKDIIPKKLGVAGFDLKELVAYKTEVMDDVIQRYLSLYKQLYSLDGEKWVVFFSPQGTEYITQHLLDNGSKFKIASIGPTTEEYLLKKGIKPDLVSKKPTAISLLEGINSI